MATDLVANVRFNVCKTLTILGPKLTPSVMTSQVRILDKLYLHDNGIIITAIECSLLTNHSLLSYIGQTNAYKIE